MYSSITENKNIAAVAKIKKPSVISRKADVELLHKLFGHASTDNIINGLKIVLLLGIQWMLRERVGNTNYKMVCAVHA
jgi:hypothetical protein